MPILVGIDGTGGEFLPGSSRDASYDAGFANSFVKRLCWPTTQTKTYFRGPVILGGGLLQTVYQANIFIFKQRQGNDKEPILLTGYSRGAAGAVGIASMLKKQEINVKAMLLFDCVTKNPDISADTIPNNVEKVLHVRRAPESGSRGSFGNSGTKSTAPTDYKESFFNCTHGGMGGTPWTVPPGKSPNDLIEESFPDGKTKVTYAQDALVSAQVWAFVQPFILENGFQ